MIKIVGRICCFIILVWILPISKLVAQHYPYTIITLKDGLPQSSVFKTAQDKQGYIWMATEAGLCRYDGYKFVNYSYFTGLQANFIFDIEFDAKGRLWIGSFGTGLAVFDGNKFFSFNKSNGFDPSFVVDIFFSSAGELWVATMDKGVYRITMGYKPVLNTYKDLGEGFHAQKIEELPNGDVVVGGGGGIYKFKKGGNQHPILISKHRTRAIYVDAEGGIWAGGRTLIYLKNKKTTDFSYVLDQRTNIMGISEPAKDGIIYVSTENGLIEVNGNSFTKLTTENGLSYDLIKDVSRDRFGNIWVATYGNGATILNDRGMTHYDKDRDNNDLCAFSIGEDKNGTIWIGEYFGGYYELTDSGLHKTTLSIPPGSNPLPSFTDANGNVYLIADNAIVYKIVDGKLDWQFQCPLKGEVLFSVIKLQTGNLLATGSFGAAIIDEQTNSFDVIKSTEGLFMKDPFFDEYGNIWALGDLGQVYVLQGERLLDYTNKINPTKAGLTHGLYDNRRRVWWFTSVQGVLVWNGNRIVQLNSGNVLKADLSFSITMDKLGRIWVGQVQGLECIDVDHTKITHLGYDQGFLPVETNSGAAFTDSKGNVWFGTLTSATKVDVTKIGNDTTKGFLRLSEIEVNGEVFFKETYNDSVYPKLSLKHYENNLDFQFVSLCFTNAKDVSYSWRMVGVDKEWITKTNQREVNYSNLAPGNYTFQVKALNPNGFVTNQIEIKIYIAKPFWKTIGFYFFEIAAFLFIVFLSFRFTRQSSDNRVGQIMTLLTIFIIFESVMLYISSYTDKFTSGIPVFQLIMNVLLAASLHPLEQRIQRWMIKLARKKKI